MLELVLREVEGWTLGSEGAEGEPMVQDVELAQRLGDARSRVIRDLISRHVAAGDINDSEVRRTVRRTRVGVAEREVTEYWLTEQGALFITSHAGQVDGRPARSAHSPREGVTNAHGDLTILDGTIFETTLARRLRGAIPVGDRLGAPP